jgi:hypothetical protein
LKKAISFRLRAIDDDLIQAIQNIESDVLSNLCRDGLRYMLGLNTTKQVIIQEKPLVRNVQPSPIQQTQIQNIKPKIFRPTNNHSNTRHD